jgi:hypothetical protein
MDSNETSNEGLGEALMSAFLRHHSRDFLKAMQRFDVDKDARPDAVKYLISEAVSAPVRRRIKAVSILGSLRVTEAEQPLFEIVRTEYPKPVLKEIARSDELITFRAQLLNGIGMAFIQIGSPESMSALQDLTEALEGSRIVRILQTVIAKKRSGSS